MRTGLYPACIEAQLPAKARRAIRAARSPVVLTTRGKPTMVVQDFASFQEQQNSLLMLKLVVQSEQSIAAGRTSPTKSVIARLRESVARRHSPE